MPWDHEPFGGSVALPCRQSRAVERQLHPAIGRLLVSKREKLAMNRTGDYLVNLGVRLGRSTLTKLVLDAIGAVRPLHPRLAVHSSEEKPVNPWDVLALLTYCYSSGIYGSRQIADAIPTDFQLSTFCGDVSPNRDDLAWFRRHNRRVLQQCLEQVLEMARQIEDELEGAREPSAAAAGEWAHPGNANLHVHQEIVDEANERITRAAEFDCMSSDW